MSCDVCGGKSDAYLCRGCLEQIEGALIDLPGDLDDLEAVMSRQARGPMGLGDPEREWHPSQAESSELPAWLRSLQGPIALPCTPWPIAPGAADLRWAVWNTLTTWWRHLAESRRFRTPTGPACNRCRHWSCAMIRDRGDARALLLLNVDSLALDEAASAAHDELTWLHRAIDRATVGHREPDVYAGRCDLADVRVSQDEDGALRPEVATCGADLYARKDDHEVQCRTCGAVYDLADRKRELADKVDDQWARPHLIASGLTTLDERVKVDTLYKWIERGDVKQVACDDAGHALYRVGDVRERIALMRDWKANRASA
jgi:hypothetical protein